MEGLVKDKNNPIHRETIYVTTIQMKHMVKKITNKHKKALKKVPSDINVNE